MQGTIAQTIALITWGNAALGGTPPFDPAGFYPGNSAFAFCEYVKFVHLKRGGEKWLETDYAFDPIVWFTRMKEDGVSSLRMTYGPSGGKKVGDDHVTDRMLVGFVGGGGRWLIEAVRPKGSDYWEARWEVGDRDREDRRIWRVSYGRIAANAPSSSGSRANAEEIRARLAVNLQRIAEFARTHRQDGFAKAFESALACLSSDEPLGGVYHTDIAPPGSLPKVEAQLLGAAQSAWVFGGMGSWNDIRFDGADQTQYDELSEELYGLLNASIVTAANSSSRASQAFSSKAWWQIWR